MKNIERIILIIRHINIQIIQLNNPLNKLYTQFSQAGPIENREFQQRGVEKLLL